jgi:hypothetical protein
MAINAMRPAHNAKVLLSERRVPLSGHSFAVIVQPSHVPPRSASGYFRRQAWLEYCLIHSSLAILPSWIRRAPDLTGHQIGGFLFSFLTTPAAVVVVLSVRHDGVMFRPSWNF